MEYWRYNLKWPTVISPSKKWDNNDPDISWAWTEEFGLPTYISITNTSTAKKKEKNTLPATRRKKGNKKNHWRFEAKFKTWLDASNTKKLIVLVNLQKLDTQMHT